jgi:hypothetical protein
MSKAEALYLWQCGLAFFKNTVIDRNPEDRKSSKALILTKLNKQLKPLCSFTNGFHEHEHFLRVPEAPGDYQSLCSNIASQKDGGIASAKLLQNWYCGDDEGPHLADLPPNERALAILSHFSETSRGYGAVGLDRFTNWVESIAIQSKPEAARELWNKVNDKYLPSVKSKDDQDYELSESENDSDDEDNGSMDISDSEIQELMSDA